MPVSKMNFMATKALLKAYKKTPEPLPSQVNLSAAVADGGMAQAMAPTDGDYVFAEFRALSAVAIPYRAITFEKAGVLKKSANQLVHQTVYRDHMTYVDRWAGVVMESAWSGASGDNPPGIDVILRIDAVQAPSVARGLLSDPPALHSVSVGVEFEWEKSHPKMSDRDFWFNLGEVVDGKLVQRVVTEILGYHEISVVYRGADRTAKRKPLSAAGEAAALSIEGEDETMLKEKLAKLLGIDPEASDEVLALAAEESLGKGKKKAKDDQGEDEEDEEEAGEGKKKKGKDKQSATAPEWLKHDEAGYHALVSDTNALKAENQTLKVQAKLGETFLQKQRDEAVRLFKLVEGEKADDAILTMLTSANLQTAEAYVGLYAKKADEKFTPQCGKCGSTKVTRQSAAEPTAELAPTKPAKPTELPTLPFH